VPATAVTERGGKATVLRVRDGKAERVDVTIGLRDEQTERVEIASGIAQGDVLLVGAAQSMTPGTPVRVRNGSPSEE
jgi:membrane fusion protein (multidrug efflux system)